MKILRWFSLLLTLTVSTAQADMLVLIHGYLSGAQTWDASGISAALTQNGWQRGGVLVAGPTGVRNLAPAEDSTGNRFYLVDLPSEAPLMLQADQLQAILNALASRHPGEAMILAGHSAGGIVARIALVRGGVPDARALITIASPHLGTPRAMQALDVSNVPFPFSIVSDALGGEGYHTLRRSQGLYVDLLPPAPGSLLGWLNNQPHPDIAYFSVIRGQGNIIAGDELVPGFSQDMDNVPALHGHSQRLLVPTGHMLGPVDATILLRILEQLGDGPSRVALAD